MKQKVFLSAFLLLGIILVNPLIAKEEMRDVSPFSKISLRIAAKVYLEQADKQSVRIVADPGTLDQIILEVRDRTLNIRFSNTTVFKQWNPGKIEFYITVPEVDGLNVSGSGDIVSETINTRILDLAVSGSGNVILENLNAEKINALVSGSGNITIEKGGVAEELKARISGSGNIDAQGIEARNVNVVTSGSGNCSVLSNGSVKAKIAGSGNVYYSGNPDLETAIAGSGKVKKR